MNDDVKPILDHRDRPLADSKSWKTRVKVFFAHTKVLLLSLATFLGVVAGVLTNFEKIKGWVWPISTIAINKSKPPTPEPVRLGPREARDLSFQSGVLSAYLHLVKSHNQHINPAVVIAFRKVRGQLGLQTNLYDGLLAVEQTTAQELSAAFFVAFKDEIHAAHGKQAAAAFQAGHYIALSMKTLEQEVDKPSIDPRFQSAIRELLDKALDHAKKANYSEAVVESIIFARNQTSFAKDSLGLRGALTTIEMVYHELGSDIVQHRE